MEQFILAMCKHNRNTPTLTRIDKRFKIGLIKGHILWRTSKNLWGRFGGGWNWKVGFQASRSTIIINLLVLSVRLWK